MSAPVTDAVRVLVVDDDALVRAGLSLMLREFDDIDLVASVADGGEVTAAVNRHRPDVVLMDIRMPGIDGLAATASLRERHDPPEVIILTTFDTDDHIRRALRAGASGFLLKHTPPEQIAEAIRRVAAGEPMVSPQVLRRIMTYVTDADVDARRDHARRLLDGLSETERAVADLIGHGKTNSEISAELFLSTATVKSYVSRILTKLGSNNRVQIAVLVHDATR
jgi:DNA-binding NarL/FixJ family response regulator